MLPILLVAAPAVSAPLLVENVIVNNGLAPPNPDNVIDANNSFLNPNGADT